MSTSALHRRLSRLEADLPTPVCRACAGRAGVQFVYYDDLDRPTSEVETCPQCGSTCGTVFHIRVVKPRPAPDAPPVAPRSAVGGSVAAGVGVGGRPPEPPDGQTGARRGQ